MSATHQDLTLDVAGHAIPAYAARPAGTGPVPGVVVIHEAWGVSPHIRSVVDRLAAAGYGAIAPNLLGFEVTIQPETFMAAYQAIQTLPPEERAVSERVDAALEAIDPAHRAETKRLMGVVMQGPTPQGLAGVAAAVAWLRAHGAPKVGVMGFCMGGGYTWAYAYAGGDADAFAPFYGRLPQNQDAGQVKAPLEGHYGADDHGIPVPPLQAAAAALTAAGQPSQVFVYESAPHAFFNDTRDTYRPAAAQLAWQRLLAFYARTLGGPV